MIRFALAFCAGAAAVHVLPALWRGELIAAVAVLGVLAARRWPLAAAMLAGFAWTQLLAALWLASAWPCSHDREVVALTGRVSAPALEREDRTDFDLDVIEASAPRPWPRRVRLAWYEAVQKPSPGECWHLAARLRCRHGFANPGAQDRELALLAERIDATGYGASDDGPRRLTVPPRQPIERLRERIADSISDAVAPGPSAAVLQGLAVGVRGNIPDRLWDAFAVTGVAHLIAISGLHVTACALSVLALLRFAWRIPRLARLTTRVAVENLIVVGVTAGYAWLSGASLPALRTLATVAVLASLRWLRRSWPFSQVLAIAAFVLVATDPVAITSAGFWLSFVATAVLVALVMRESGWLGKFAGFAKSQLSIMALLTPVLAATFGRLSLIAPVANAVAIPVFGFVLLPAVLAGSALAAIAPAATAGLWRLLAAILDRAWPVLEAMASWPFASWSPAAEPLALMAAAGALAFAALLVPVAGLRLAAAAMLLAITCGRTEKPDARAFSLAVIDVGQGLAAVVETANHALVFDTGPSWRGGPPAARVSLLPYLRARGVRDIDLLVVSHDDQDHAGGVELLRRELRVGRTMAAPGSRLHADSTCLRGDSWTWDGVAFRVLHPPAGFEGSDNDRSCALAVSGPGGTALLLADPEAAAEAALVAHDVAADVVLLPHHGSRSSSSPELVHAASARLGIASAGFGNRWGMPDAGVVARWRAAGTTILDTAEAGAIRVRFPAAPGPLEVSAERHDRPRWWRDGTGG
jgi:competence protein ComEC